MITAWEISAEDERVFQRGLKFRRADDRGEVAQADEAHGAAAGGGVADAIIERHEKRHADEQNDVEDRGANEERTEPALAIDNRQDRRFWRGAELCAVGTFAAGDSICVRLRPVAARCAARSFCRKTLAHVPGR